MVCDRVEKGRSKAARFICVEPPGQGQQAVLPEHPAGFVGGLGEGIGVEEDEVAAAEPHGELAVG